ncbi:hypothetical protein Tco_1141792 [Tanacetum coccineum]
MLDGSSSCSDTTYPSKKITTPNDIQYCMEDLEQAFVEYASLRTDEAGAEGDLRKFSDIGAWYAIKDCAQYDKKYSNRTNVISDETIVNPNAQIVGDDMVMVQVPRCMTCLDYDEHIDSLSTMDNDVRVTSPESTTQTLPSFEEYTPPVTYPEEVEKTLGTLIEVEPLDKTQLKDLGLNTCNHDIPLSSRKVPSFDKPEPQPKPLANCPTLDVSLGDERGPQPPIKPHSPDSFRMKVVEPLSIHTPPSPHVASFHPKDMYCYYRPCVDDPKKHYGSKPGRGLNSPVRPKEVENVRIKETHQLEHKIQQIPFQHMAPSRHHGVYRYYHPHLNSSQNKCIKDPIEIHHIKQREGESTEDFVRRFKIESRDVKGAPEVMRISGFMHGITNPELIKRLHDKIPKSVDEIWKITTAFLRGEVAAGNLERKKTFPPWKQQDIMALDKGKFRPPPQMTTPVEKRNASKFCEFHGEVGHTTDECMHLKRQIEEMLKVGKLSHLIKELKKNNGKDQAKVAKKGEAAGKDKP